MKLELCAALFLVVAVTSTPSGETESEPEVSLAGLDGVTLFVEEPDSNFVKLGVTTELVQTPVLLALRQNEIPVLNEGDTGSLLGNPVLYVVVTGVINEEMHQYAYQVQMELTQTVTLHRDPPVTVEGATTWRTGGMALSGPRWREALMTDLDALATEFVDAYLEANAGE